jgi:type I restriction enzyme S subunit
VSNRATSPFPAKRLKYVVSLRRSRVDGSADDRPYIGLENIESWTGRRLTDSVVVSEESSASAVEGTSLSNAFEPGDVLFGKLRPYLAKTWVADFPGRSTTELLVMQPAHADPRFLMYVCLWRDFIDAVGASTYGSKMPRAEWDFIGNMTVPVPPLPQQRAIADYLGRETARIDALIAAKERVLGLLAEKRRALITRAVTRGLDPHARLHDSCIPWLGEIPAHWLVKRVKYIFRLVADPAPEDNEFELLSLYTDIGVRPRKELEARGNKATTTDSYWMVQRGDLIVNKLLAWMGAFGVSDYDGVTSPAYDILRPIADIEPHYYHHLFRCGICQPEIRRRSYGIMDMRLRLYFDRLGDMAVPVPPREEQRRVLELVQAETSRLDRIHQATERTIALLKERRATLIAAAVTGQIDVGAAA